MESDSAEGVRFELTREQSPLPVFKTGALNHSATLPSLRITLVHLITASLIFVVEHQNDHQMLFDRS
jgi:hypothetical protein